jgi:N-acetylglucosaminyl-diphospho-decaprenol L-rhamnosyltransferase
MNGDFSTCTAVIVTYNSRGHINNALAALRTAHDAGCLQCVVVDNASTDGTADLVAANHPWVNLVHSKENLGFGCGCNLGFQQVATPYLLIHNPDAMMDHQALQIMMDFMESRRQAGIVAPAIVEGGSRLQAAGLMTSPAGLLRSAFGFDNPIHEKRLIIPGSPPFQTPWICGAVMLIRSELFRRLGGFDPRFFLYFEETDFCRRAALADQEIWAVGEAVARHVGGASARGTGQNLQSSCIAEHYYRSRFYYLVKHFGWFRAVGTETLFGAAQYLKSLRRPELGIAIKDRPFLRFPAKPKDAA